MKKAKGKRQKAKVSAITPLPLPAAAINDEQRVNHEEKAEVFIAAPQSSRFNFLQSLVSRRPVLTVAIIASTLSIASFIYFFSQGMTNHYGDGVAHVNIARKVVDSPDDSLWQRYIQIGTPWLPLQTVLMLPLVANDFLWRTGVAGSIVSMISFVVAAVALYLLAKIFYRNEDERLKEILPLDFRCDIHAQSERALHAINSDDRIGFHGRARLSNLHAATLGDGSNNEAIDCRCLCDDDSDACAL